MWHCKRTGSYTTSSIEGQDNANEIASYLLGIGWVLSAICAFLGNGAGESGLNPWRWESDNVPTRSTFENWTPTEASTHGYGLLQFTPANKYINNSNQSAYTALGYGPNFADRVGSLSDGTAQLAFFADTFASSWLHGLYNYYYDDFQNINVDINDFYYISDAQFILGQDDQGRSTSIDNLVGAFELCYERPADWAAAQSYQNRVVNAWNWWYYFQSYPPTPPTPQRKKKMPLWMLLRYF